MRKSVDAAGVRNPGSVTKKNDLKCVAQSEAIRSWIAQNSGILPNTPCSK